MNITRVVPGQGLFGMNGMKSGRIGRSTGNPASKSASDQKNRKQMNILLECVPFDTTEAEIRLLLEAWGVSPGTVMLLTSRVPRHCAALVEVEASPAGCRALVSHLDGSVLRGSRLRAEYYLFFR
ncbi:MAG: RNA-binding protein [Pseudomonadota bacterium]|nr:RNA-binding protein [Pseudomonadota bacterium]